MNPRRSTRFVRLLCRLLALLLLVPLLLETGALPCSRPMLRAAHVPAQAQTSDETAPDEDDGEPLLLSRCCESHRRTVALKPRRGRHAAASLPSCPSKFRIPRAGLLLATPTCPIPLRC